MGITSGKTGIPNGHEIELGVGTRREPRLRRTIQGWFFAGLPYNSAVGVGRPSVFLGEECQRGLAGFTCQAGQAPEAETLTRCHIVWRETSFFSAIHREFPREILHDSPHNLPSSAREVHSSLILVGDVRSRLICDGEARCPLAAVFETRTDRGDVTRDGGERN